MTILACLGLKTSLEHGIFILKPDNIGLPRISWSACNVEHVIVGGPLGVRNPAVLSTGGMSVFPRRDRAEMSREVEKLTGEHASVGLNPYCCTFLSIL